MSPAGRVPKGYTELETLRVPAIWLPFRSWWQSPLSSFSAASAPESPVNIACIKSPRVAWWCHCRIRNTCMCGVNTAGPGSPRVKSLQPVWVGAAERKRSRGLGGELENLESLLQWAWPGLAWIVSWWACSSSVPSFQFFPLLLGQPRNPVIHTLLLERLRWQTKAPHRTSHPHPAVSKVTVGNLETGLGTGTEDALRARSQSSCSFHSGQRKAGLFCDWTMSVLRGCVSPPQC